MHRVGMAVSALALLAGARPVGAEAMKPPAYPQTARGEIAETQFGETIADPYRWLENDARTDPKVADWIKQQNALTDQYLGALPQREWFAQRIKALMDYERFGLPRKAGKRYFYTRNSGLQNQAQLFVRDGFDGTARLLLDPNSWARDGATALDDWEPSERGRYLAYSVQDGGSDWRTIRIVDAATGAVLGDELRWAKFTTIAWLGEEGFLYSRFPVPDEKAQFQAVSYNHAVYFHRIGTPQDADQRVYDAPAEPRANHVAQITSDGRYAVISSSIGTDARIEVHVIDLAARRKRGWTAQALVSGFANDWRLVDGVGSRLWFATNSDAPRYRLVSVDLAGKTRKWQTLVAEADETLQQGTIVGDKLVLNYLKNASSRAVVVDLNGRGAKEIGLRGIGTAMGFTGRPGDPETFYSFASFNQPAGIYRLNLSTGAVAPFATPRLTFKPDSYAVEQRFYTSRDGTQVPLFLVRKKELAGKAVPTLLYGYGGFDVSLTPGFSASRMAWLEAGGAFAMANLRGGGEFGKAWHDAGRLANKQNVFDDFIAAGEYLIREGITPRGGLTIQGGSNGGLLVGAVVNQRPDLFAAANPAVGVMDMLRFDRFTAGRYWVDDYGYPDKEADWRVLRAYSPYHNIKGGTDYPALLVTTADTDDRVVPGHSFKYTAALQAARLGAKPHLIRIETRAGHGTGKPTDKVIAENADILAFLAEWSGLTISE